MLSGIAKKTYIYKMITDNGGAPCPSHGLLSLAICKPTIRRCARAGDYVLGFSAVKLPPPGRLIYIMRVTDWKPWCDYAINYPLRRDCIYCCIGGAFSCRTGARFKYDMDHDLGFAPKRPNAFVLLSTDFRYFGRCDKVDLKSDYPIIHERVTRLQDGHAINHVPRLQSELEQLIDDVWKKFPNMGICRPTNPRSTGCHRQPDECEG